MNFKEEKDILDLKKWCDEHKLIKEGIYSYQYFDISDVYLKIVYFSEDLWEDMDFIFFFEEKEYNNYNSTLEPYTLEPYRSYLLSNVLSEIRLNKINSLLQ